LHVFGVAMLKSGPKPKRKRPSADTGKLLLKAAAAEFNQRGYDGTDSNRIARRAGFAPQTFYRWYKDKEEIFIEVYREWQSSEAQAIGSLLQVDADDAALVDACVGYHESYRKFRRSLRQLSYERPRVRAARAESRAKQVAFIQQWYPHLHDDAVVATALLQIERLSDALAEGEFRDLSLPDGAARAELARIIRSLRGSAKKP
jgi:AcrR family transcriptional regulator